MGMFGRPYFSLSWPSGEMVHKNVIAFKMTLTVRYLYSEDNAPAIANEANARHNRSLCISHSFDDCVSVGDFYLTLFLVIIIKCISALGSYTNEL